MTTPPPPPPLQTTDITAILLHDGWHDVAPGTVPYVFENPRFADPFGGPAKAIPGLWLWWAEASADGSAIPHGTPVERIYGTHWNPPEPQ